MGTMASQITSHTIVISNRLFGRRSKKTSKLRVTALCEGNSPVPVTGEFPAQMAGNAANVSIWWRHHDYFPWFPEIHPCCDVITVIGTLPDKSKIHMHENVYLFYISLLFLIIIERNIWKWKKTPPTPRMNSLFKSRADTHPIMMTSSNGTFSPLLALCAGNSPVTGELPSQRPVTQSFDVFFYLRMNKGLRKQPRNQWFDMPSRSLWRHCNGLSRRIAMSQSIACNPQVVSRANRML